MTIASSAGGVAALPAFKILRPLRAFFFAPKMPTETVAAAWRKTPEQKALQPCQINYPLYRVKVFAGEFWAFFWGDRRWDFWGCFGGVESDGESWHRRGESTAAMSGSFHFFLSSMLPAFAGRQAPGSMSGDMYWIPGQARNDV